MTDQQTTPQPPVHDADLKRLHRLVGTWDVSGEAVGQVRYEWMEGGMFLMQHVNLGGEKGLEIIGRERGFDGVPSAEIKSRYYGQGGSTLDYTHELIGDTLMIWFGDRGSPAYYKGTFSEDGNTLTGDWVYPNGGGYHTVSTRMK